MTQPAMNTGLMHMPPWLNLDSLGLARGFDTYVQTSSLDWIIAFFGIGSLLFLGKLLHKYSQQLHGQPVYILVEFELRITKSVFLIALTNLLPIAVFTSMIPFWKSDCFCAGLCLPLVFGMKSFTVVSAIHPMVVFIRRKKLQRSLLGYLCCLSMSESAGQCMCYNNKVGLSESLYSSNALTFQGACHFRKSVVCSEIQKDISVSAKTFTGSVNNLFDLSKSSTAQHGPVGEMPSPPLAARLSLLSVCWNKDPLSHVMPFDLHSSSETLHSMASMSLPFYKQCIDVHLNNPPGGSRTSMSTTEPTDVHQEKLSRFSIQMSTSSYPGVVSRYVPSSPRMNLKDKSQDFPTQPDPHLDDCSTLSTQTCAWSDILTSVFPKEPLIQSSSCQLSHTQSVPSTCIEQDNLCKVSRKSSSMISILTDMADPYSDSSGCSIAFIYLPPEREHRLAIDCCREDPNLPGSVVTLPERPPKHRFTFSHRY